MPKTRTKKTKARSGRKAQKPGLLNQQSKMALGLVGGAAALWYLMAPSTQTPAPETGDPLSGVDTGGDL